MSVQEIIKRRRLELNLTLKQVAKALGVSEGTVSRYESGEIQNMGIDKIEALSRVLRCSPGFLMGWEDSANPVSDTEEILLSSLELQIIMRFRLLSDGERNMFLRSLGIDDTY